jgi:hypothetical protein
MPQATASQNPSELSQTPRVSQAHLPVQNMILVVTGDSNQLIRPRYQPWLQHKA